MAGYHKHIDHEIKDITPPPFRYPSRAPSRILSTLSPETTEAISTTTSAITTTTEIPSYLSSTIEPNDYENEPLLTSTLNETVETFYRENLTNYEQYNTTLGDITNNGTQYEIIPIEEQETQLVNITKAFDWIKPPGTDLDNNILRMSQDKASNASSDVRPDYTLYIILASILTVLIILTIVTIMLYKAYKKRDQYSLTSGGNRVRVFRSALEEEATASRAEREDYEIVDFDKNSYRF